MNDDTFVHRRVSAGDEGGTVRIGVVVPIPGPWAELLVHWRTKVGDPQASLVPPHVTLLPPTEVPVAERRAIAEHLSTVAGGHAAFDLHLTGTDTFRPVSEVVYVAVADGAEHCRAIASDVRSGPLHRSLAFPYHPHVTVAQDVPADMLDLAATELADIQAQFRVETFIEFEQEPGGSWAMAHEYRLGAPPS